MVIVTITIEDLERYNACGEEKAAFLKMFPEGGFAIDWGPLADYWAAFAPIRWIRWAHGHKLIPSANFQDLILANISFVRGLFNRANFHRADLHNADFSGASCVKADFGNAYLDGAVLKGALFELANFSYSCLHEIDGSKGDFASGNFTRAELVRANLFFSNLEGANFFQADLRAADLRHAYLRRANFRGANLNGADLRGAIYEDEDLYGIIGNPILNGESATPKCDAAIERAKYCCGDG